MDKEFIIDGNTLDFGTKGRFGPGSEQRLVSFLKEQKDGQKTFDSLVSRGAIKLIEPKKPKSVEPPAPVETSNPDPDDEDDDSDDTETVPTYEATGKYYFDHYGGGNCNIIDPEGRIIEEGVRPQKAAKEKVKELNSKLEE